MKRPSFQFYPADWAGNSNLKRCTHEEKGIWMDVMCILHDQEEYGVARWTAKELSQAVGCSLPKLKSLINKGILKGADSGQQTEGLIYVPRSGRKNGAPVTLIEPQKGPIWFSSRMVIDEHKRIIRGGESDSSKGTPDPSPKGGIGEGIDDTPKGTPDPSPSRARPSSTSSSSSTPTGLKEKTNKKEDPGIGDPTDTSVVSLASPGHESDKPPSPVSPQGAIATYVRSKGIHAVSTDLELQNLVKAGATMAHFVDAVPICRENQKGWKYLLGIVKNMLQEAQAPPPTTTARPRKEPYDPRSYFEKDKPNDDNIIDANFTVVGEK